jgi:hypothetical protein
MCPQTFMIIYWTSSETCSQRGGGILLGVDALIPSKRRFDLEPSYEVLVVDVIRRRGPKMAVILCYRPPSSDLAAFNDSLESTLNRVAAEFKCIVLLGDFNLPNIDWQHADLTSQGSNAAFVHLVQSFALEQINYVPSNIHGHLLDFVITNDTDVLGDVSLLPFDFPSDHNVLFLICPSLIRCNVMLLVCHTTTKELI